MVARIRKSVSIRRQAVRRLARMARATTRGRPAREAPTGGRTMANFLLTFHGGSMPETKEEQDQVMKAWTDWFGTLGDRLVDGGNPISNVKTIAPGGSVTDGASNRPSGYSVIKADSIDDAVELAKGCPVLEGGANVVVAETFPVM
jgi:hypothetical protein